MKSPKPLPDHDLTGRQVNLLGDDSANGACGLGFLWVKEEQHLVDRIRFRVGKDLLMIRITS